MAAIADHHPEPVGGHPVPSDDDATGGGDVAELATHGMAHRHRSSRQFWWHRVAVTAVGHQCLARGSAGFGDDHRIRCRRQRREWFGLGHDGDRGAAVGGGAQPGVAADAGEAVHVELSRLHGEFVGEGAPPALGGSVIDLLHHTLAVTASWRADRHRDAVVLGHPGERGGHSARARVADSGHPVEPPHPRHPSQATADVVERGDEMRLIL